MNRQDFERYIEQGGRLFVVVTEPTTAEIDGYLNKGEIIELRKDDGSDCPSFYYPNNEHREARFPDDDWCYLELIYIEPHTVPSVNHYDTLHQPIETMQANMTPEAFRGYLRGNLIKYTCRIGRKDGEGELKEAKKIQDYAKWLVESLEGKTINPREVGK